MDTHSAWILGQVHRNKPLMVFDWVKAAQIIKEREVTYAEAGLERDFEYTAGPIWVKGKPDTESYTYLASRWATPQLIIHGEAIDCWVYQEERPTWNSDTKWPQEALDIIGATEQ